MAAVEGGAPFVTNFSSPNLKPPVSLLFVINCWWYIRNYIYENLNTWASIMYMWILEQNFGWLIQPNFPSKIHLQSTIYFQLHSTCTWSDPQCTPCSKPLKEIELCKKIPHSMEKFVSYLGYFSIKHHTHKTRKKRIYYLHSRNSNSISFKS